MSNTNTPKVGDTGVFYGSDFTPERAEVLHVWSDTCVNVRTASNHLETSVPVLRPGPGEHVLSGYHFVPDQDFGAPVTRSSPAGEVAAKAGAPRVTPDDVAAEIVSEHYFTAAEGVDMADPEMTDAAMPQPLKLLTFCVMVLRNGFTVTGESACASPENFDAVVGRAIARKKAVEKVWPLLGFRLRDKLSSEA